jgi:hypothetical protein
MELVLAGKPKTAVTSWADLKTKVAAAANGDIICWVEDVSVGNTDTGTTDVNDSWTITNGGISSSPITIMCGGTNAMTTAELTAFGGTVGARHLTDCSIVFACNDVRLWGFEFSGRIPQGGGAGVINIGTNPDPQGATPLNGQRIEIHRCEIHDWGGATPAVDSLANWNDAAGASHGINVGTRAHDYVVNRCEIHHPLPWTVAETERGWRTGPGKVDAQGRPQPGFGILKMGLRIRGNNNNDAARRGIVRYSYFHDQISRPLIVPPHPPIGGDYEDYHMGQCDYIEVGSSISFTVGFDSGTLIDTCLFDNHFDNDGAGVMDIKMSGVMVRNVTVDNSNASAPKGGNMTLRGDGGGCTLYRCYLSGRTDGSKALSENNTITASVFESGCALKIGCGNNKKATQADAPVRAKNTKIIGGTGRIQIGDHDGGSATVFTVPAENTAIEGHTGTYVTDNVYSWTTSTNPLYHETGSTRSATTADTTALAVKLVASKVGPTSTWIEP